LIRALSAGGAERQAATLARGLAERGHDVRLLLFYGGAGEDAPRVPGISIKKLGKRGRWDMVRFYERLRSEIRDRHPDVLYSMLPAANIAAALAWRRRRGAALVMGVRASRMRLGYYDRVTRVTYALETLFARRADAIIANSRSGRDAAIARGFPSARLHVVFNGIDVARFRPDKAARARWRTRLGIADDDPVIGLVARVDPMKAHDVFLDAAAQFRLVRPRSRFILAGTGAHPANTVLTDAIARRGLDAAVALVGERTDIESLYPAFDIASLSSAFGEGFPNAVAEAMAAGVPCVATDVGDCRDIVAETGRIVAPGDAGALVAAWESLLTLGPDERASLGAAARARVVAHYDVARLVEETEMILRMAVR
jgi:glycosyltransferase involved in cell wall biosynthesis